MIWVVIVLAVLLVVVVGVVVWLLGTLSHFMDGL